MNKNETKQFSPMARARSFKYAFNGLKLFFTTQHNSWIHLLAVATVTSAGFYFDITKTEWLFVVLAFALVLITEIVNTAFEFLVDFVSPEYHEMAGKIKDLAAGAVLLAAIASVAIGALVFGPYLLELISA